MKRRDAIILAILIALLCGVCNLVTAYVTWVATQWSGSPADVAAVTMPTNTPSPIMPTPTPTETFPTATPVVPTAVPTTSPAMPSSGTQGCRVINDYNLLEDMDHVATSGDYLHVEFWYDGQPERETVLPTKGVPGGRYDILRPLRGHVWEYSGCSLEEVMAQVNVHINRRLEGGANNAGFVPWQETGYFRPVTAN